MTLLHILAGTSALLFGTIALAARKGGRLHRRSGKLFVYAMLVLSSTGALMAAVQPRVEVLNVIAGVLTFYFVSTALLAVRRPVLQFHWLDAAAMLVALAAGLAGFVYGFEALGSLRRAERLTAPPSFMFGGVALLAALGDVRMLFGPGLQGKRRIARHLWRMCFGFFIAVGSFLLGPPQRLPPPLRGSPWLPLPVLLVVLLLFYWLVRVKFGKRYWGASPPPLTAA
jgi:uncharacterized membrane protein